MTHISSSLPLAIVPINALARAKTRLAPMLDRAGRRELVMWMAARTLRALTASECFAAIAVVSPDPEVLAWAREHGAVPLVQAPSSPTPGLNEALELGRAWAIRRDAPGLLVALADLPLLTADDVAALLESASPGAFSPPGPDGHEVVVAPDRATIGTNLLWMRPAGLMPFAFGEGSLAAHVALARLTGVQPVLFQSVATSFDVDTPDHLAALSTFESWPIRPANPGDTEGTPYATTR